MSVANVLQTIFFESFTLRVMLHVKQRLSMQNNSNVKSSLGSIFSPKLFIIYIKKQRMTVDSVLNQNFYLTFLVFSNRCCLQKKEAGLLRTNLPRLNLMMMLVKGR